MFPIKPRQARLLPSAGATGGGISKDLLLGVRPGTDVLAAEWEQMFSEGRLRTRAQATARRTKITALAYSHATAAALHGIPLYRIRSDRTDVIVPGKNARRRGRDIVRHHTPLPEDDVVVIDGLRVTSLDRTVYDVIRSVSLEAAVVAFDAALRQVAWNDDDNSYDFDAAERFRDLVRERILGARGARGIRQSRFVVEFADGRAQLPGESIARLWMWQLGVPMPELQYRVELGDGKYAILDFAWPALRRWAEFDGLVKYTDAEMLAGRTGEEVIAIQHERERAVRRVTSWRVDRWGFEKMPDIVTFAAHLRSLGF